MDRNENSLIQVRRLASSFAPIEFMRMMQSDPQSIHGRYQDICGPDIGAVMSKVGWSFVEAPVTVGVELDEKVVAVAFAAPITLWGDKSVKSDAGAPEGINLSYAIHSDYEGMGLGFLAACEVLKAIEERYKERLNDAFLNIQTRGNNARSNGLADRLMDATPCAQASFVCQLDTGESIEFVGYRASFQTCMQRVNAHLSNAAMTADKERECSPSCA